MIAGYQRTVARGEFSVAVESSQNWISTVTAGLWPLPLPLHHSGQLAPLYSSHPPSSSPFSSLSLHDHATLTIFSPFQLSIVSTWPSITPPP
jgi:hypothetical protein